MVISEFSFSFENRCITALIHCVIMGSSFLIW
nr:MAG TPA: hypothetical protein [Caudoviricetes sp.]